jgi:hypothetical protein
MIPQYFGHSSAPAPMMAPYMHMYSAPGWGVQQSPRGWPYPFPYQWGYASLAADLESINSAGAVVAQNSTQPLGPSHDSAAAHAVAAIANTQAKPDAYARGADTSLEGRNRTIEAEPKSMPVAIGVSTLDQQHRDEVMDMYLDTINHSRLSKAEAAIAIALRRIFPDASFEKVRPKWLMNHSTKRCLEIDLFCEALSLGIERQGLQHFVYPNGIHTSRAAFEALQQRDALKIELAKARNVTLIFVPFTVPAKDAETFLRDELRRLNFSPQPSSHVVLM